MYLFALVATLVMPEIDRQNTQALEAIQTAYQANRDRRGAWPAVALT